MKIMTFCEKAKQNSLITSTEPFFSIFHSLYLIIRCIIITLDFRRINTLKISTSLFYLFQRQNSLHRLLSGKIISGLRRRINLRFGNAVISFCSRWWFSLSVAEIIKTFCLVFFRNEWCIKFLNKFHKKI